MVLSKHFRGVLYTKLAEDLQLAGFAKRTHDGYLREIRKLAQHCKRSPEKITESQLRRYFLFLKNDKHYAEGSLRVTLSAFKFFYRVTCPRKWETLGQLKVKGPKTLPEVITPQQVHQIIDACTTERMSIFFWTVYSMGLRLPHVHFVVPGGGVHESDGVWQQTPENFFLPQRALSRVYRAKFADHMRASGLCDQVDSSAWMKPWTVDIKPVGNGRASLKYLAAYVYRVGLSNKRIVSCDENEVRYRYTPTGGNRPRERTVSGNEFLRGMLQHTLPSGLQKIRYYGWMSPNSRLSIEEVRWMVMLSLGIVYCLWACQKTTTRRHAPRCSKCGGDLRTVLITDADGQVVYENGLGYLDSG